MRSDLPVLIRGRAGVEMVRLWDSGFAGVRVAHKSDDVIRLGAVYLRKTPSLVSCSEILLGSPRVLLARKGVLHLASSTVSHDDLAAAYPLYTVGPRR